MPNDKDTKDSTKKLVLSKKTIKRLGVRTGVRTGLPLTDGCENPDNETNSCPAFTDSCQVSQGMTSNLYTGSCRA